MLTHKRMIFFNMVIYTIKYDTAVEKTELDLYKPK